MPTRRQQIFGTAKGLLVTGLLLSCNQARVDLGGYGAGGSSSPSRAMMSPVRAMPPPAAPPFVSSSIPTAAAEPIRPFDGLESRATVTPPIAGGTLAVAADGSIAVASDPDRDVVFLIDPVSSLSDSVGLPNGSEPGRVVLDDMGQAHVVLRGSGKLARINLSREHTLTLSEPLCQHPRGLAYEAGSKTLHLACADGQLLQLSAADHAAQTRERLDPDLRDVVVLQDGRRVVSRFRSAQLQWVGAGGPTLRPPELPWPKLGVEGDNSVVTSAAFAFRIQSSFDGLWMLHEREQVDQLGPGDAYDGRDTGCGPVVQPALSLFAHTDDTPSTRVALQLQGVAAPAIDFAFSPTPANTVWVAIATPAALASSRATVQLQQMDTLQKSALIREQVEPSGEFQGTAPEICQQPAFVALETRSQAVAVAWDGNGLLYVQSRYPAHLSVYQPLAVDPAQHKQATVRTIKVITLADDEVRDLGHEWFHAELGASQLSCAACHAEGLDDGHTWVSSTGARRTPNLRGGIKQTARFFWDGQLGSFDELVTHVVTQRVAAANLGEKATNAMLEWLDRLPALSVQTDDPAAASGKKLFGSLGCRSCHSGPQLTNNRSISLGAETDADDAGVAQDGIQVPSLLGLALRGPYMHDGCALNLGSFIDWTECSRPMHRKLAALSKQDAAALEAYLLSL